jgi:hypothetical protein
MGYLDSIGCTEDIEAILTPDGPKDLGRELDVAHQKKSQLLLQRKSKKHFQDFWVKWMREVDRQLYGDVVSPYEV